MRISDWSSDVCSSDLADVRHDDAAASAHDYPRHVRDVDADTPARFNADPRCLFEASGSAGKMMVFAVRLDTLEAEPQSTTFYIGCNDQIGRASCWERVCKYVSL